MRTRRVKQLIVAIVVVLLMAAGIAVGFDAYSCRRAARRLSDIRLGDTLEHVQEVNGAPTRVRAGRDLSSHRFDGKVDLGANDGSMVFELEYSRFTLFCDYFVFIGASRQGVVVSKRLES